MKILGIVALCLLAGCAARTPLAELEEEALMTGEWSEVEKHREMDKRMNRVDIQPDCPNGRTLVCYVQAKQEVCGCVSPRELRQ
jgi:hypothetical protein